VKGEDDGYRPPPQWSREPRKDLEEEARRLAKIMTTAQRRSEEAAKRLHSRLNGWRPIDEAFADEERREVDGNVRPYPRRWGELADKARELSPDPFRNRKGPRFDIRSRPHDE